MTQTLFGKLFADAGYFSQPLFEQLCIHGLQLIPPIRSNMKNQLMPLMGQPQLRKRFIFGTIKDLLKNNSQISHLPHRSIKNFVMNQLAGLIA